MSRSAVDSMSLSGRAVEALEQMRRKLVAAEEAAHEPLAVIGLGCRFPGGADDPDTYWSLLEAGADTVTEIPPQRWDVDALYDPDPMAAGKIASRWGSFLRDVDRFDPAFFGISPREALSMDPQQRLFLEVAWEALEHAGQPIRELSGSRSGVFVGITLNDYAQLLKQAGADELGSYFVTGTCLNAAAGRLSYLLGLKGPSMAVDTACSSSLVAVSLACRSLRAKECDLAVVGGVNLILTPEMTISLSKSRVMAPDGHCKTFDAKADGYVRGEGCGAVILKRLSSARADGDRILALIRGTAVNQDGPSSGLTVPNGPSQQDLVRDALADARVEPHQVGYVEAHGTGTSLGDPIELKALGSVLGQGRSADSPLVVSTVKTNLGHLEAAAGIAGLIKVVLTLDRGRIPPHLHFSEPNPHIPWSELPVEIPRDGKAWPRGEKSRIAGVSSFGVSGTNAHLIVEEAPLDEPAETEETTSLRPQQLLVLSAHSTEALAQRSAELLSWLEHRGEDEPSTAVRDLCHTAAARRSHHSERLAVVAGDRAQIGRALEAFRSGEDDAALVKGRALPGQATGTVFVFPGQGSQWLGMGRQLLEREPAFRRALERCDAAVRKHVGWSVLEEIAASEAESRLAEVDRVQPVLFSIQVALAALWRSWGVTPVAVVGHSMGEVAAAAVAGALSLDDAAKVICLRSRLLKRVSGKGAMAVAELSLDEAREAIAGREERLSVAVNNSPRSVVLSGEPEALDEILAELSERDVFHRLIKVDVASHSPLMDPLRDDLLALLEGLAPRDAEIPIRSTVEGKVLHGRELGAEYWVRNLRRPVLLWDAVRELAEGGVGSFVELSPHPVLLPAIEQGLRELESPAAALPSARRQEDESEVMLSSVGALYCRGQEVDWSGVFPAGGAPVDLPSYPFQRDSFWPEPSSGAPHQGMAADSVDLGHPLVGRRRSSPLAEVQFENRLSGERPAFLADHLIYDHVVVPGAHHVATLLVAGQEVFGTDAVTVAGVEFPRALVFGQGEVRPLEVVLSEKTADSAVYRVFSRDESDPESWLMHSSGRVEAGPAEPGEIAPPAFDEIRQLCGESVSGEEFYRQFWDAGYTLGPGFRWIGPLWRRDGEALCRMSAPEELADAWDYPLHPCLVDCCFQLLCAGLPDGGIAAIEKTGDIYAPFAIDRFTYHGAASGPLWCHAVLRRDSATPEQEIFVGDVLLSDGEGRPVAEVEGLHLKRAPRAGLVGAVDRRSETEPSWFYRVEWQPTEALPTAAAEAVGRWLILDDSGGVGEKLAECIEGAGGECLRWPAPSDWQPGDEGELFAGSSELEGQPLAGIVHLWSLSSDGEAGGEDLSAEVMLSTQALTLYSVPELLRALRSAGLMETAAAPRLVLVTRGAVDASDARGMAASGLSGLGSVLGQEHPELRSLRIDLASPGAGSTEPELEAERLWNEILSGGDDQVASHADGRRVARLVPAPELASGGAVDGSERIELPEGRRYRLEIAEPGILDHLSARALERRPPKPGEVEIAVSAAGLNFRDVLGALGKYPGDPGDPGVECVGEILAVGDGVDGFAVGDRVMAFTSGGTFASHVNARHECVALAPAGLGDEEAATVPGNFLTAHYGLSRLAGLAEDETVLIHSASGGVGLAAIEIAHRVGASVYATAGSPAKRRFLRDLGVHKVMDSRSLAFADEVMEETAGRGVDVVLNSLPGDYIPAGLSVLAEGGRFIEIGKTGIWSAEQVAAERSDVHYQAFDLVALSESEPRTIAEMLGEISEALAAGELQALPYRSFPMDRAVSAFRLMASAGHIGKIVLSSPDSTGDAEDRDGPVFAADRSVLITGGLGGIGLALARWLVEHGARSLMLVGRSAAGEAASEAIRELEAAGAAVRTAEADVADFERMAEVVSEAERELAPLGSVFHAAGLLADGVLSEIEWSRFRQVFPSKVAGTWNLHRLTAQKSLDHFVLFSAAATLLGSAGQGNYAAANAFLDALARHRRGCGLPALSVNWGPWAEIGLAAAEDDRGERLARRGLASLEPERAFAALGLLLESAPTGVAVMDLDAAAWRESYPQAAEQAFFSALAVEESETRSQDASAGDQEDLVEALRSAPAGRKRRAILEKRLRSEVGRILRMSPGQIDREMPLKSLGLDSLTSLELRNRLEAGLGLQLSATVVWNYPTVVQLATFLGEELGVPLDRDLEDGASEEASAEPEELQPVAAVASVEPELAGMSEAEAEELLVEKLAALEGDDA